MAEYEGKTVGVYISTALDTPVYKLAICLTSNKFDRKSDTIDTSSKCDDGWASFIPGRKSWTVGGDGLTSVAPGSGLLSANELDAIYLAGEPVLIRVSDAAATADAVNIDYTGQAVLTSLSETFADNDVVKYTFEFTGKGAYTNTL